MLHVELIQNEWAAGHQHVVARILLNGAGHVHIESDDEATWGPIALKPFREPDIGRDVSPDRDPELFVRSLHKHLAGDYLFATKAHEQGECEFLLGDKLPLTTTSADETSAANIVH